jgi:hypothetical protein
MSTFPLIVVIPPIPGFSATVYKQLNETNIVAGTLGIANSAFGVLFRSPGKIVGLASQEAQFEYFALNSSRPCPIFSVTTSASDRFVADRDQLFANLTIKNSQKYCLFYLSNSATELSLNYSTEDGYDILYLDNGKSEEILTGRGSFSTRSSYFTRLSWISDASTLSDYFTVQFESPLTTLPAFHLNYTARSWPETSTAPVILYDRSLGLPGSRTANVYAHADADWYLRTGDHETVNTLVLAVVSVFVLVVTVIGICLCLRVCRARETIADDSQLRILNVSDIAGVRELAQRREDEDDVEKPGNEGVGMFPPEILINASLSIRDEASGIEIL